ncbi:hypothetical protein BC938DRAFT_473883 [Jimgerdemannia flammicorona]|uniref:Uncharacterized protein n=1 Tax=Jimgerdemannia flammicorona TaxID=994334 RepID=A0A433Q360_9FUNG|nr:hypothetical protein BC938DRAFT_473883 [Jimgerdemannia flammicorona]
MLGRLLEGIIGNKALDFQLKNVTGGHQMVVVDKLDERLDLGAPGNTLLTHVTGNLQGVSFDTSDNGVTV